MDRPTVLSVEAGKRQGETMPQVARLLGKVTAVTHVAQLGSGGYRVLLPALSETQAVERVSAALRSAGGKDTVQIELAPLDTLLFVGNLGDMSDEELRSLCTPFGPVVRSTVIRSRSQGNASLGYGIVEYLSPEAATKMKQKLSAKEVHGRAVRVDWASTCQTPESLFSRTLFIDRIPRNFVDESALASLCKGPEGTLEFCKVALSTGRSNAGKCRGFALCDYTDHASAEEACRQINGAVLGEAVLRASFANPAKLGSQIFANKRPADGSAGATEGADKHKHGLVRPPSCPDLRQMPRFPAAGGVGTLQRRATQPALLSASATIAEVPTAAAPPTTTAAPSSPCGTPEPVRRKFPPRDIPQSPAERRRHFFGDGYRAKSSPGLLKPPDSPIATAPASPGPRMLPGSPGLLQPPPSPTIKAPSSPIPSKRGRGHGMPPAQLIRQNSDQFFRRDAIQEMPSVQAMPSMPSMPPMPQIGGQSRPQRNMSSHMSGAHPSQGRFGNSLAPPPFTLQRSMSLGSGLVPPEGPPMQHMLLRAPPMRGVVQHAAPTRAPAPSAVVPRAGPPVAATQHTYHPPPPGLRDPLREPLRPTNDRRAQAGHAHKAAGSKMDAVAIVPVMKSSPMTVFAREARTAKSEIRLERKRAYGMFQHSQGISPIRVSASPPKRCRVVR